MTNRRFQNDADFIKIVKQLSRADQKKLLWHARWLLFTQQFSNERIRKRVEEIHRRIGLISERCRLRRIRAPIEKEINALWKQARKDFRLKAVPPIDYSRTLAALKKRRNLDLQPRVYFQPWLSILDQGLIWLTAFYLAFTEGEKSKRKNIFPVEILLGTVCSQAISIRVLCSEGFDLQAKAILRTFLETLLTCILIMRDEDIRNEYRKAEDVKDAYLFWRNHMKGKNLVQDIHDLFVECGLEEEHVKGIIDWVNDEFRVTSQAVHPSFAAAIMATYPLPLIGDTFYPGILGVPTSLSRETLSATSKFLWLFSKVSMKLLLEPPKGKRQPMFKVCKGSESSKLMVVSFSIFDELVVSYWGEDKETSSETAEDH